MLAKPGHWPKTTNGNWKISSTQDVWATAKPSNPTVPSKGWVLFIQICEFWKEMAETKLWLHSDFTNENYV